MINLLPPERRSAMASLGRAEIGKKLLILTAVSFASMIAVLIGLEILLRQQEQLHHDLAQQLQQTTREEQGQLLQESIHNFNLDLARVRDSQQLFQPWTPVISELLSLLPKGLHLTQLGVNASAQTMTLNGIAATRNDLIDFQKALETSQRFTLASSPISNLLERENIVVSLTLNIHVP